MRGLTVIGMVVLLVACTGQAPQRPSQRKGAEAPMDTAMVALMTLNKRMTEAADEQLMHVVSKLPEAYALYERGTWVYVSEPGDKTLPVCTEEACTVAMRIYSLDSTLLYDTQQTGRAGKYEFIPALDENLTEWHHGARLTLYAPWYAAYGITGQDRIPPYENVRIELEIK